MKRILFILSIFSMVAVIVACNSAPKTDANALIKAYQDSVKFAADTAGLAQFQAWKAQNELTDPNQYGQPAQYAAPIAASSGVAARRSSSVSRSRSSGGGTMRSESGNTAKAPARKKGWSKAAKGAAIGGGRPPDFRHGRHAGARRRGRKHRCHPDRGDGHACSGGGATPHRGCSAGVARSVA